MTGDPTTAPRELAQRWAVDAVAEKVEREDDSSAWDVFGQCPCWSDPSNKAHTPNCLLYVHEPLTPAERERLFAWVCRFLSAHEAAAIGKRIQAMADELGLTYEQADELRRAARWPS